MIKLHYPLLRVNGEKLSSLLFVLISKDHFDLISPAGHHRRQVVGGDVDGPLLLVQEHAAHARGDPPHHSDLATEPGVLVTVLDHHLDVRAVPVLVAEHVCSLPCRH